MRTLGKWIVGGFGVAAAGYGLLAASAYARYGRPRRAPPGESDTLLDELMPVYDIVERHHIRVDAAAEQTLAAATGMDLSASPISRAIFKAREVTLGGHGEHAGRPVGLLALMKSLGWGVLAEEPGREIVMGAVTRPWEANVVFQPLPAETFRRFNEPGYVKIAWTLRADPLTVKTSVFRTETRAIATDAFAARKFRNYWAMVSPGVWLIRRLSLRTVRRTVRWAQAGEGTHANRAAATSTCARNSASADTSDNRLLPRGATRPSVRLGAGRLNGR